MMKNKKWTKERKSENKIDVFIEYILNKMQNTE